jgi:hypothetical protein
VRPALGRRREQAVDQHVEAELESLQAVAAGHRRAERRHRRVLLGVEGREALGEPLDLARLVVGVEVELAVQAVLVGDRVTYIETRSAA